MCDFIRKAIESYSLRRDKGHRSLCGTEVESLALVKEDWGSIPEGGIFFMSLIMMGEDVRVIEEERR